jgi:RNA polymerase primary sigma factor
MEKKADYLTDEVLEIYFRQIKAFPLLTFDEELELSKEIQKGSADALSKLVNSNLRLVVKIARLFCIQDASLMDLIQEGNMGLIHAAEKYDFRRNFRFSTYASWWIRQSIVRYISVTRGIVRLPHRKEEILRKIRRAYNDLSQTLMYQPQNTDIAGELGIPLHVVDSIINISADSLPLTAEFTDDVSSKTMEIHEDYTYCPERNLLKKSSRDGTLRILGNLKDDEKRILICRYQLDGDRRKSLREIGAELDISPETVRQIEMRALKKIRSHAKELRDCVYVEAI